MNIDLENEIDSKIKKRTLSIFLKKHNDLRSILKFMGFVIPR